MLLLGDLTASGCVCGGGGWEVGGGREVGMGEVRGGRGEGREKKTCHVTQEAGNEYITEAVCSPLQTCSNLSYAQTEAFRRPCPPYLYIYTSNDCVLQTQVGSLHIRQFTCAIHNNDGTIYSTYDLDMTYQCLPLLQYSRDR